MTDSMETHSGAMRTTVVAQTVLARWGKQELEGTLACMAETIEHVVNVDGATVPFGASTSGKPAMRDKLAMLANTFSFEAFVVDGLYVTGIQARCRILILARHRRTEDTINLRFRLIMEVRDGLIARMEEYHDAAYVEAFMRLVGGG